MPSEFSVSEEVEELIKDIITNTNFQHVSNIEYCPGSEIGDGYASKTIAANIHNGKESLYLFLKCALKMKTADMVPIEKIYANEIYFYDIVYPAYEKFAKERNLKDSFRNAPKCYGTSLKNNIVALENLKKRGFRLFDRTQIMNDNHIALVLKTFAKFHAISFAFKDQEKEKYEKLVENTFDFFSEMGKVQPFHKITRNGIQEAIDKLDPIKDKDLLNKCDNLADNLTNCITGTSSTLDEYSIITQGDCWCNNMMFLYDNEDYESPKDIMLIDWQIVRPASPVYDVSYFFYTIACEETLSKLEYYLRLYHQELSSQIKQLGSDPEILYPYSILKRDWKMYGKYGFGMAFTLIKFMLSSKDEAPNFEEMDMENFETMETMIPNFKQEEEYLKRIKILMRHIIDNDLL